MNNNIKLEMPNRDFPFDRSAHTREKKKLEEKKNIQQYVSTNIHTNTNQQRETTNHKSQKLDNLYESNQVCNVCCIYMRSI